MRRWPAVLLLSLLAACGSESDVISLSGKWRVNPVDRPEHRNPEIADSEWAVAEVPGAWRGRDQNYDIVWYRRSFVLPEGYSRFGRALTLQVNDADETFLNGTLIGATGSIEDRNQHAYGLRRVYPLPPELLQSGKNVLAVRVRGWSASQSGIQDMDVTIRSWQAAERSRAAAELRTLCFSAIYLACGIYFALFFLRLPVVRPNAFFAVFCFVLADYIFSSTPFAIETFGFLAAKRMEYIALFILPVSFVALCRSMFQAKPNRWMIVYYGLLLSFLRTPLLSNDPAVWNASLELWYAILVPTVVFILIHL